jgi:ribosomal protein S18 acetylase RimI-like enzyme
MKHVLDRPIWSALTTRHASLSKGGDRARRYDPSIVPFGAACDDNGDSLQSLGELARADDGMVLLQADPIVLPPGCAAEFTAEGVQMVLERVPAKLADPRIERLTEADAEAMVSLAELTKPGPFTLRAQALGEFHGVKIDGRLVAMAGERMKTDGFTEVSGVCVHPDFQGRGLGRLVSLFVTHRVLERGETPFLHAFASNTAARALYGAIGFELRTMMNVAFIRAEGAASSSGLPGHT